MKIKDYRYSDCNLFRTPVVSYDKFADIIAESLAKAFKNGYSANDAMNAIGRNSNIKQQIENQLKESIGFQRNHALSKLHSQTAKEIAAKELEKDSYLQQLENNLGTRVQQKIQEAENYNSQLNESTNSYSASQQKLEDLRARIRKKIRNSGGRKQFEKLMEINSAMSGDKYKENLSFLDQNKPESSDLERALDLSEVEEKIDPLKGQNIDEVVKAHKTKKKTKKHSKIYAIFRKTFGFLYKHKK
ncbi:MAG: hypothetical protein ABIC91_07175 [Nanoarchaeota archaeon]|nr:hypothetical protein [Nanoarchaeota archaeon]MBU1031094.1 hypothetical protein [Nanoarchaeota archaeon]MBU1849691.1 hypothetical protein [Nanoarchaeota archaeon]